MNRATSLVQWVLLVASFPLAASAQTLTLGEAVESALSTHPSLRSAFARAEAASQELEVARAARLPGAFLSGNVTRFDEPMVVAPLHSFDPARPPSFDNSLVQGRFALEYTLFDAGMRSSRIEGASARMEAAGFTAASSEMELIERVVESYVAVLSARAVHAAALAQLQAVEEEHTRALQRVDAGSAPELEVLRAAASLQDARAEAASGATRVGLSERSLARVMGTEPTEVAVLPLADISARPDAGAGGPSTNPVVARAERVVGGAAARLREERAGRMPSLELGAALLDFGTITGDHVAEWQAGIRLSWPVFTGGVRSASIRRAEADLRAAESDLAATRLRLAARVDAAQARTLDADERTAALESSISHWEELARIEALALDAGAGVQSDLLQAEAGLFRARAGHATARYDAVLARVELARAQGNLDRNWLNRSLEIR